RAGGDKGGARHPAEAAARPGGQPPQPRGRDRLRLQAGADSAALQRGRAFRMIGEGMKRLAGFVLGILFSVAVHAQAYPTKPIRLVVPFGPGGVADITARTVTPEVSKGLGQQFVIENKPSAGGAVAGQDVAHSAPDGYTLLLVNNGTAVSKALFKSLPYDPEHDFEMISTVGFFPLVIMTDTKSPIKSIQDVVSEFKKNPGKYNVGTIGIGSTQHLA